MGLSSPIFGCFESGRWIRTQYLCVYSIVYSIYTCILEERWSYTFSSSNIFMTWILILKHRDNFALCIHVCTCMKAIRRLGEWRYSSTILHLAIDGGKWSASRPMPFYLRGKSPDIHWIGGWEGLLKVVRSRIFSSSTLKMEAISYSETSVNTTSTQRHIPWQMTAVEKPY
jgi:hypothetical protein